MSNITVPPFHKLNLCLNRCVLIIFTEINYILCLFCDESCFNAIKSEQLLMFLTSCKSESYQPIHETKNYIDIVDCWYCYQY